MANGKGYLVPHLFGAALSYIGGLLLALIALWVVNIIEYISSLTVGNLLQSVIAEYANWPTLLIFALVAMFPYLLVVMAAIMVVMNINTIWLRRAFCLIMGATLIILLDPDVKYLLPSFMFETVNNLQEMYYITSGPDLGRITSGPMDHSVYDYRVFDFYTIVASIAYYMMKD